MAASQRSILIVEDDPSIRRGLVDAVTFAGYRAIECDRGDQAAAMTSEVSPDLVLLDVLLPGKNGFDILAELRASHSELPVIMVTAKGAESDRVNGLAGGADDYVVKPFSPRELLARIEAVLRRTPERTCDVSRLVADGVVIDLHRREVKHSDGDCEMLTDREAAILRYLAVNRGQAVDRDALLQHVWGLQPRGMTTRTVDMHIARLREKIAPRAPENSVERQTIATVRGKGYMLAEHVQCADRSGHESSEPTS